MDEAGLFPIACPINNFITDEHCLVVKFVRGRASDDRL